MTRVALAGLGVLLVAALGYAFWLVGGPGQARMDARDQARLRNLEIVIGHLRCTDPSVVLPDALRDIADTRYCDRSMWGFDDAVTNEDLPMVYTRLSDTEFRLCQEFEDMDRLSSLLRLPEGLDPATGCYTGRLRP